MLKWLASTPVPSPRFRIWQDEALLQIYALKKFRRLFDEDNTAITTKGKLALAQFTTFGYSRLACIVGVNRKPIQRILQPKG
ncbi:MULTISPECIES: hypothetical protein [unclassified Halomonas]|uniref:hypothetical protein n=1 Tax=unclassified Halomonas TaxID=2609666 RepID=UPI001C96394B|nr:MULTISPECIES: hypothetical protein [unclassified Halomonas]MBY5927448.1 hypothetical protein [Halomonas sp. DP4Y7-2]MBY6234489.1 hypothetical protein [Halomonas sp. DP4Y7-1]